MNRSKSVQFVLLGMLVLLLLVSGGCGRRGTKDRAKGPGAGEYSTPERAGAEGGISEGIVDLDIPPADRSRIPAGEPSPVPELRTVYFEYNRFNLTEDAVATLESNLAWILARPNVMVRIEGHCDERGSEEYNLALGDKRATAIRNYLVTRGANADSLVTISFGESRPVEVGHDESAWRYNRRGEFKAWQ
ncbi:OmpA family protein [bacterium]|nr:OmpA family protein [bacterium]